VNFDPCDPSAVPRVYVTLKAYRKQFKNLYTLCWIFLAHLLVTFTVYKMYNPRVEKRESYLDGGFSGYNTETMIVDHRG
jgi:hypothetical protein